MNNIEKLGSLFFLLNKKPEEIVKFFKEKDFAFSFNWYDIWQEAHLKVFTVAKVMKLDILQDIRESVESAIENGDTFQTFKKKLIPILQSKGWWGKSTVETEDGEKEIQLGSVRRLKTIYNTNIRVSYNSQHFQKQNEVSDSFPYLRYNCKMGKFSREPHKKLNGKIFPINHPIWKSIYPPNGWGCECWVTSMSKSDIERYNKMAENGDFDLQDENGVIFYKAKKIEIEENPEIIEKEITGKNSKKIMLRGYKDPSGNTFFPEEGWNYNPGERDFKPDLSIYDKDLVKEYNKIKMDNKNG